MNRRPRRPRRIDFRAIVRGIGRTMIGSGLLLLLFVAYQLWGTNFYEARSQRDLKSAFAELAAPSPGKALGGPVVPGGAPEAGDPAPPTTAVPAPPPAPAGEAVAVIRIPKIELEKAVVEGVGVADLKKGPGHYPQTPMPGQPGNAAIAGHRTTYGAPFWRLDELAAGDIIEVSTRQGNFRYEVTGSQVVTPDRIEVLAPTEQNILTLTTCEPRFSARLRLIIVAKLLGEAAPAPIVDPAAPDPETPADPDPSANVAALEDPAGLSGVRSTGGPAVLWGSLVAAIAMITWAIGRLWRRVPAYALGAAPFFAVLFVFFENVSRLLPANI